MAEDKKTEFDILVADSIYPDAESIFTSRFKSLQEIKNDCYIVLDTNALLVPYSIGKESLEQIQRTYKMLVAAKRLIIPSQVAREFAKNRANKISELYQQLSMKRDSAPNLNTGNYPLLYSLKDFKNVLHLEQKINKLLKEYREEIANTLSYVRDWVWDDPVSLLYRELFADGVVKHIQIDKEDVKKDLFWRQLHKVPPGYKDSAKPDEGIGDLLIWRTILETGSTAKKSVIFVSGEEKPDWWHLSNKQPLYPRYELVDEFRRVSEGQTFHIIKFSRFIDLFGASEEVVREIQRKEVREALARRARELYGDNVETYERLNLHVLEQLLDRMLPSVNKSHSEEYYYLLRDLKLCGIRTPEQLESLIQKHLRETLVEDSQRAAERLEVHNQGGVFEPEFVERIKKGGFYKHIGLVRKMLELEFGEPFRQYLNSPF